MQGSRQIILVLRCGDDGCGHVVGWSKPDKLESPRFTIDDNTFQLRFHPRGDMTAAEGHCSLYLVADQDGTKTWQHPDQRVSARSLYMAGKAEIESWVEQEVEEDLNSIRAHGCRCGCHGGQEAAGGFL